MRQGFFQICPTAREKAKNERIFNRLHGENMYISEFVNNQLTIAISSIFTFMDYDVNEQIGALVK